MHQHKFTSEQKIQWWGYGEWVEEIDFDEWEYKGVKCRILRMSMPDGPNLDHMSGGFVNGYICVPKDHPWYKIDDYDSIDAEVHGGLTFLEKYDNGEMWIGFDTSHSFDYIPSVKHLSVLTPVMAHFKKSFSYSPNWNREYRNVAYVKKECENLVDQMLKASNAVDKY